MSYVSIDVPSIVEFAREAGASEKVCEKLRARLEVANQRPSALLDHADGKTIKLLDRLTHGISKPVQFAETAQALYVATEIADRLILGQWRIVAEYLPRLKTQKPSHVFQEQTNAGLDSLIEFLHALPEAPGCCNPPHSHAFYAAHRTACILRCQKEDCDQRECWETRGWCGDNDI